MNNLSTILCITIIIILIILAVYKGISFEKNSYEIVQSLGLLLMIFLLDKSEITGGYENSFIAKIKEWFGFKELDNISYDENKIKNILVRQGYSQIKKNIFKKDDIIFIITHDLINNKYQIQLLDTKLNNIPQAVYITEDIYNLSTIKLTNLSTEKLKILTGNDKLLYDYLIMVEGFNTVPYTNLVEKAGNKWEVAFNGDKYHAKNEKSNADITADSPSELAKLMV
jgi:hypothetical protein